MAGATRIDMAKALLRLETMSRLNLGKERQRRMAAEQQAVGPMGEAGKWRMS